MKAVDSQASDQHSSAARLASDWGQHELACDLFALAERCQALGDEDCLEMALATLAAAEQLRLPYGRNGAWARHKVLLIRAESMLVQFSHSQASERLRAVAMKALAKTLRLQHAAPKRIEAVLVQAAELHLRQCGSNSGVAHQQP